MRGSGTQETSMGGRGGQTRAWLRHRSRGRLRPVGRTELWPLIGSSPAAGAETRPRSLGLALCTCARGIPLAHECIPLTGLPGLPMSLSCSLPRTRAESRARRTLVCSPFRCGPLSRSWQWRHWFFFFSGLLATFYGVWCLPSFCCPFKECGLSFPEHVERGWAPKAFLILWGSPFCVFFFFFLFFVQCQKTCGTLLLFIIMIDLTCHKWTLWRCIV